jgi:hypothetical protein
LNLSVRVAQENEGEEESPVVGAELAEVGNV